MADVTSPAHRPLRDAPMLHTPRRSETGRPSKYKTEYCDLVIEWGKQGKSRAQMCALLNIGRATMAQWEQDYSAFGQAYARAKEHAQAWWEAKAQSSLGRKHFQAQLWRYSMAGRFKEDYAEARSTGAELVDLGAAILEVVNRQKPVPAALPGDGAKLVEGEASTLASPAQARSSGK